MLTITNSLTRQQVESAASATLAFVPRQQSEEESAAECLLSNIVADIQSADQLSISSLKHISAAAAFADEAKRWLTQLRRPALVTDTEEAMAVGKAMSWYLPDNTAITSVIVVNSAILNQLQDTSLFRGILYHEIAHIHDNELRMKALGNDSHPDARDLTAVERFIAASFWAEYFCERIASRHYSDADLTVFEANATTLQSFLASFSQEKDAYRYHARLLDLWQQAIQTVGHAADLIGRTLGEFYGVRGNNHLAPFLQSLANPTWSAIISESRPILDQMYQSTGVWNADPLLPIVRKMFHAIGMFPKIQGGNLWVDVP